MCGMLKPDGKLLAECTDYSGGTSFDGRARGGAAYRGFPDIGARLPVLFLDAGLTDVRMHIFQHMELAGVFVVDAVDADAGSRQVDRSESRRPSRSPR